MILPDIADCDPEHDVLVAAVRDAPELPSIADEVRLAAVANWHRLEGVLARVLVARGMDGDDPLAAHFTRARAATEQRHAILRDQLVDLLGAWGEAGIIPTLLKGFALVEAGVVPAGERPMADLDLLVDDGDAIRAHALAREAGFSSTTAASTWEHATTRHHHLPALVDATGRVRIELHHRLLDVGHAQSRLDELVRGRRVPVAALDADRLDDVALWLHLAVHCWDDRRRGTGGPLLQLRDLDLLLGHLDIGDLVATTRAAGAQRLVGTVASVLEVVVPSAHVATLRRRLAGPAPDDPLVTAFVHERILGRRSPLAQLVHPTGNVDYTAWRLATRLRRQLWPGRHELERVLGVAARRRDHLAGLMPVARDAIGAPTAVLRDVRLDHWAHGVARDVST